MTDMNKERAEFEAWYASRADATDEPERTYELDEAGMNDLTKDCILEGWQARASLAAKAPAAPTGWYALAADGMATLCVDRDDAEKTAADSEKEWPNCGPFRAVQLYTAPPAPTEQWRDIETAPQDGTRVILAEAEKVFHGGFVGVQFKEHRDADGNYLDQTDADAYWMNFEEGDVCHPTHWQPEPALPAPPQGAAKGANDAASS